jgi:hypothetical protein
LLDEDLAALYAVTTGRLNEAVKRNIRRFPPDFMFQLTAPEHTALISQNQAVSQSTFSAIYFVVYRRQRPWMK